MIDTNRLKIVPVQKTDIETIIAIENHPDNRDFIWQGTYEEHVQEILDPSHLLLKFLHKTDGKMIGYALIHLNLSSNIFELRRIAITEKGQGYGREVMEALIDYAFKETRTNRLWLDVYPDNKIGIKLYESLGFVREGVLRQNYKSARGYLDQIIYSILREDYENQK